MADPMRRVETAETQAAEWHARLGAKSVSTREIEDFFAWRSASPANADAYRRVELIWGQTGKLGSDPEMERALEDALGRNRADRPVHRLPRTTVGIASLGAALALVFACWFWWEGQGGYSTSVGELRSIQLADGSTVRLDTNTRIRVRFAGSRRLVELEGGQAMFTVAHDRNRPFVVQAGDVQVTAVGTVFDVRRRAAGASVTLVSGVVDVTSGDTHKTRMTAGTRAEVGLSGAKVQPIDVAAQTSWTDGKIIFRDATLRQAVTEVNRYLTDEIVLDPGPQDGVLINGVFRTGDREAFVSTASEVLGLQATRQEDGSVRLSPRAK